MSLGIGGLSSVGGVGLVTRTLIGINVAVYLLELATGGNIDGVGSQIFEKGALFGPLVANGDWWRLITAAFLALRADSPRFQHVLPLLDRHTGGAVPGPRPVPRRLSGLGPRWLGRCARPLPTSVTVGASGAIFGILGAALVLERQGSYVLGGSAMGLIVINLALSFVLAGISIGGHIGGLIGGAACMLVLSRFGRGHGAYGRIGASGIAGLVAVAALSVVVAYWKVRGYAS